MKLTSQELLDGNCCFDYEENVTDNFEKVESVRINNKNIDTIPDFSLFSKTLRSIIINKSRITKIEGLDNLSNLIYLDLSNNQITKIEGLDNCINLELLKINYCFIEKIEGLHNNIDLKFLSLKNNQITKI